MLALAEQIEKTVKGEGTMPSEWIVDKSKPSDDFEDEVKAIIEQERQKGLEQLRLKKESDQA